MSDLPAPKWMRALLATGALVLAWVAPTPGLADDILATGSKLYSQFDEELIIRHFFQDRSEGVFLDVGSYHWKRFSTTYYLEAHLGWSGIAIDASPVHATGYAANRPRTKFFNYLVTDHSGTRETLYVAGPISSALPDQAEQIRAGGGSPRRIQVETTTLDRLLDAEGVTEIDFLSMDIEGSEPGALAGFSIRRFMPELVCIEAGPTTREAIAAYFASNGYERIDAYLERDTVNWYYRPKPEDPGQP